jgi:hypothetical protein
VLEGNVISPETLFHFTNNAQNLLGILKNEFQPRYCLEDWTMFTMDGLHQLEIAIPMVCFCDLPLSKISKHLQFYGSYGIGLSKQWGVKKGINPILYLNEDAYINNYLATLRDFILPFTNRKKDNHSTALLELFSFIKVYEGRIWRNGEYVIKKFYDEREWRWVPRLSDIGYDITQKPYRLMREDYLNQEIKASADQQLSEHVKLSFEPDDIKYLIVREESEIVDMISNIRKIKDKYSSNTIDLLTSRIISAEQILSDF